MLHCTWHEALHVVPCVSQLGLTRAVLTGSRCLDLGQPRAARAHSSNSVRCLDLLGPRAACERTAPSRFSQGARGRVRRRDGGCVRRTEDGCTRAAGADPGAPQGVRPQGGGLTSALKDSFVQLGRACGANADL